MELKYRAKEKRFGLVWLRGGGSDVGRGEGKKNDEQHEPSSSALSHAVQNKERKSTNHYYSCNCFYARSHSG